MNFNNFLKGPLTSAFGIAIMVAAVVAMYTGNIPVVFEGIAFFGIGFSLLFLRDELPLFIRKWLNKKTE